MKTVYMVFNNNKKMDVINMLYENLKFVFEDYVNIKICFLEDSTPEDLADGDLFVVLYKDRVHQMNHYITSLEKVVVISRTIQKKDLPKVFSIPEGNDVLVVNDTRESTIQTINALYELGLNHLNLIPYLQNNALNSYENINFAITPGELNIVPAKIKNIINIHNRYIALDTFITIINKLEIHESIITSNLIKYTSLIAQPDKGINKRYVNEHLKSEMLKKIIHNSQEAIMIADRYDSLVYVNKTAENLFGLTFKGNEKVSDWLSNDWSVLLGDEEYNNKLMKINGTNFIVNKKRVNIIDQTVGYSIILNDEKSIKNIGNNLSKQLVESGLVAKYNFDHIICKSTSMKKCIALAKKVATTNYTVLITGESGTGKELLAQSIHNYSDLSTKPFVAVNCASLPESLLESELFGYEKGAFTGASDKGKIGLFERANGGTIFLDEIGDMSLNLQVSLLRVLQEKSIRRLGSEKNINIQIRILAATNKNLSKEVADGNFRKDLYFRICNIPIEVPSLSERKSDILYILKYFLKEKYNTLSQEQKSVLCIYDWPGNVRELKNFADYFNLLNELPMHIQEFKISAKTITKCEPDFKKMVLDIIFSNSNQESGIGRSRIIYHLESAGFHISDGRMRHCLESLNTEGLIHIKKGRGGCIITEKGKEKLQ